MGHLATRAYDGKWFGDSRVPFGSKMMLEVIEVADNLKNKKGTGRIDERRSFAGLAPLVSGTLSRLRPLTAHLWAALHDIARETTTRSTTRQRPKELLFVQRIEHAVK